MSALLCNQRCQAQNLFMLFTLYRNLDLFPLCLCLFRICMKWHLDERGALHMSERYKCFYSWSNKLHFCKNRAYLIHHFTAQVIDWLCRQQGCNSWQGEEYFLFTPCPGLTSQCSLISIGLLGLQWSKFAYDHSLPSQLRTHTDLPPLSHTLSRNKCCGAGVISPPTFAVQ